LKWLLILP